MPYADNAVGMAKPREPHALPSLIEDGVGHNAALAKIAERIARVTNYLGVQRPPSPQTDGSQSIHAIPSGLHAVLENQRAAGRLIRQIEEDLTLIENAVS